MRGDIIWDRTLLQYRAAYLLIAFLNSFELHNQNKFLCNPGGKIRPDYNNVEFCPTFFRLSQEIFLH